MPTKKRAYEEAGVSIEAGNRFVEVIQKHLKRTYGPRVVDTHGGFAGLFRLDFDRKLFARNYRDPVLAACTDGVGTKLKLAFLTGNHRTVGIDLVAMSVNDLIVTGAEPLFFLDYLVTGKLEPEIMVDVLAGIADGCSEAGCALLGGETAEHPGDYPPGEYDLAGFAVGVVERDRVITPDLAAVGDKVIGLNSTGMHSNGYSLARKVFFKDAGMKHSDRVDALGRTIGEELLTPTRIYVRGIIDVLRGYRVKQVIHGMAHVTGGGLVENLPRAIGPGLDVKLRKGSWAIPPVFPLMQKLGKIDEEEMYQVFNMGIGFCLIVSDFYAGAVLRRLRRRHLPGQIIGEVVKGKGEVVIK
jgi:phosphoribosylformylglycinamidine cyclo-ligase